jgi:hypothetical protein
MTPTLLNNYRSLALGDTGVIVTSQRTILCGWTITNINAAIRFVKLYNKATAASAADTPVLVIGIPPGETVSLVIPGGLVFSAGISARCVTTIPDAGATGAAANEIATQLFYQ